jgi:hypothetical protein
MIRHKTAGGNFKRNFFVELLEDMKTKSNKEPFFFCSGGERLTTPFLLTPLQKHRANRLSPSTPYHVKSSPAHEPDSLQPF